MHVCVHSSTGSAIVLASVSADPADRMGLSMPLRRAVGAKPRIIGQRAARPCVLRIGSVCILTCTIQFVLFCLLLLVLPSINWQEGQIATSSLAPTVPAATARVASPAASEGGTTSTTIAYCISVTSCGGKDEGISEGAAVLAHSIRRQKTQGSRYDAKLYAFVHPVAEHCSAEKLARLGYQVQVRETPINATQIKGEFLRRTIQIRGCCQEKELLKLYAYTLSEPVSVHLDVDFLILKPLDKLFDAIIGGVSSSSLDSQEIEYGGNGESVTTPRKVDAFFTRDYNLSNRGKKAGMQGGFLIVRPSLDVYEEYRQIILEGDHRKGSGWSGLGHGGYYGAQQIQGLVAHYYDFVKPGTAIELNRCIHNTMADNPRDKSGNCRTGAKNCEDCRSRNIDDIYSAHFTVCQKPWKCPHVSPSGLCADLHRQWFQARKELEMSSRSFTFTEKSGKHNPNVFLGYCSKSRSNGYIPLINER